MAVPTNRSAAPAAAFLISLVTLVTLISGCAAEDAPGPAAATGGMPSATGGSSGAPATSGGLVDEWVYSGSSYPRENGTTAEVVIAGELSLRANGTWEHWRRIGGVTANGQGTYQVAGTRLTLKHDDASQDLAYDYLVGTHTDATGRQFKALTLSFGDGWKYLLVEKTE